MQGDIVLRLIVRNLTKSISGEMILNKVSYSFEKGRIYGICGREASHRALMLRCISGEERFERGYIRISNRGNERKLGFNDAALVYEKSVFTEMMTGSEFVKYYMDTHNVQAGSVEEYLDLIDLPQTDRNRLIIGYSEDMIYRIKLLCMYISAPDIIIIEEPFAKLSDEWNNFNKLLEDIRNNHIIIIASGNFDKIKCFSDEILLLNDGVLCGVNSKHLENINEIDLLTVNLEEDND